ncbi:MAG: MC/SLC25 family protein, partial [Flammeovirgaceae bacterium]
MNLDAEGVLPYKNTIDCFIKSVSKEGIFSLWVGIETYYFRVAPHAMISILAQDYLHD